MTAGGFAIAMSALQLAQVEALYTIGAAFDVLPAVLFLHVYLAFPDGYLKSSLERVLVAAAYVSGVGLQLAAHTRTPHGHEEAVSVTPRRLEAFLTQTRERRRAGRDPDRVLPRQAAAARS